jgi:hypothetical protein
MQAVVLPQPSVSKPKTMPTKRTPAGPANNKPQVAATGKSQPDLLQKHPLVIALREQITQERTAREAAENYSDELKRTLQAQSQESKAQKYSELQGRVGTLCGIIGKLATDNKMLEERIKEYSQEIIALQAS